MKNLKFFLFLILITQNLLAQEILFEKKKDVLDTRKVRKVHPKKKHGNLPSYYQSRNQRLLKSTSSSTVLPKKKVEKMLKAARPGDIFPLKVNHSLIAFRDETPPVVGEVLSGPLKGAKILGTSRLEANSKRIFIDFSKLSFKDSIYSFNGKGLGLDGTQGLNGKYHSQEAKYFAGDFLASMTAAYFDGLIPSTTNPYGQVIRDNSVDSAFKKGLASGAMSTANRFREKLQKTPEFSEIKGPTLIKVLIIDQPKRM